MAIDGQTQPQKFSLYRYREGKSDLEHGKWFKRQDQGGPNKRTMQRLLLTLGLVAISLRSSLYAEDPIRYDSGGCVLYWLLSGHGLIMPGMALIVFLRGVNVGGHRTFRPSIVARELSDYDVLNVGAAGTFDHSTTSLS